MEMIGHQDELVQKIILFVAVMEQDFHERRAIGPCRIVGIAERSKQ